VRIGGGTPETQPRHQQHSDFVLIATQAGMVGNAIYLGMLLSLGRAVLAARSFATHVLALLWVSCVATSTFNSLLWDPTEAYWFLLLSGALYVDCTRRRLAAPHPPHTTIAQYA
jgi:O-antigen ligase